MSRIAIIRRSIWPCNARGIAIAVPILNAKSVKPLQYLPMRYPRIDPQREFLQSLSRLHFRVEKEDVYPSKPPAMTKGEKPWHLAAVVNSWQTWDKAC